MIEVVRKYCTVPVFPIVLLVIIPCQVKAKVVRCRERLRSKSLGGSRLALAPRSYCVAPLLEASGGSPLIHSTVYPRYAGRAKSGEISSSGAHTTQNHPRYTGCHQNSAQRLVRYGEGRLYNTPTICIYIRRTHCVRLCPPNTTATQRRKKKLTQPGQQQQQHSRIACGEG